MTAEIKTWQELKALTNNQWPDGDCMKEEITALRAALEAMAQELEDLKSSETRYIVSVGKLVQELEAAKHVHRLDADMFKRAIDQRDALQAKLTELEKQEPCAVFLGWNDDGSANLDAACEGPETLDGENVCLYLAAGAAQKKPSSKGCPTCKHSDSWGMPDCSANGATCYSSHDEFGSNWEPLNTPKR